MKKDFTADVQSHGVVADIEKMTAAKPADPLRRIPRDEDPTPEDIRAAQIQGRTQGRKGTGLKRINLAFDPDVYEYVSIMSTGRGMSITKFINMILRNSMEKNSEGYAKICEDLKKRESEFKL